VRHANEFWDHYGVFTHDDRIEGGDLILFSRCGTFPTHIGIVRDPESYIHAPGRDGTRIEIQGIEPQGIPAINSRFKVIYSRNPIGYKSPTVPVENPDYRYRQRPI
jgi:cell wall-associated NlpC family hydrolase